MKWLLDRSTRGKLMLSMGLVLLFMAVVIAAAYAGITAIRTALHNLYTQDFTTAVQLKDVRSSQNAIRGNVLNQLLQPGDALAAQLIADSQRRDVENDAALAQLTELLRGDAALSAQLQQFIAIREDYKRTRNEQVLVLIANGQLDEAEALVLGVQAERDAQMRVLADDLIAAVDLRAQDSLARAEQNANAAVVVFVVMGSLALLAGFGVALFLDRIIANPLKAASALAEQVAAGNLAVPAAFEPRADEVGALQVSLRRMTSMLRDVNREVREGVNVLAATSSEILAATTQMAAGAAETATAVSQTTTTVEEVKQTSHVAAQKAKLVSDTAQRSVQVSQSGKQSVDGVAELMNRIQDHMQLIATSIVRLSEQGQAIGEINATVTSLAERSNLLAVNAAIEATRASDQGKGFAVVAQEVRSLAEQSRQATAQVRAILADIQKATSAAVMATEQGSKAVEAGLHQSLEAGEAIRLLADTIAEAAQAATQIAASSQQQLVGMDQVALAMENIRVASNQNVASTRQSEAAAQNLHDLGQKLKQLMEPFQV